MEKQPTLSWWWKASIIASLVLVWFTALSFILQPGAIYDKVINIPNVRYRVLPPYDLAQRRITGIVVENRGRATAHDVFIRMSVVGSAIEDYEIISQELWELKDGGRGDVILHLWLDRLASGSSLTVYLTTASSGRFDDMTIATEEGPGRQAGPGTDTYFLWWELLSFSVALLLAFSWSVFLLVRYLMGWVQRARA